MSLLNLHPLNTKNKPVLMLVVPELEEESEKFNRIIE